MAWRAQLAWERMADLEGVCDASHLLLENACTGTRMLTRSCWMSATTLFLSVWILYPKRDIPAVQEGLYRRDYMVVHVAAARVRL